MPAGRPSKYNDEIIASANAYIDQYEELGHVIPSAVGLALTLGIRRSTLYDWGEKHEEFSDILDQIQQKQEMLLVSKGLSSEFNSNITKLVLGKHGYHEKVDNQTSMNVSIDHADAKTL
jgi:hypothetical protein